MRRSFKLLLATVAILAVLCSGAWAKGPTQVVSDLTGDYVEWEADNSPYVVSEDAVIKGQIRVTGVVELILYDNCTLSADASIQLNDPVAKLTITTPNAPKGTGKLAVSADDGRISAIGEIENMPSNIKILGGKIIAHAGEEGTAIGGSFSSPIPDGDTVEINGGIVYASADKGSGIGCGPGGDEKASKLSSEEDGCGWIYTTSVSADISGFRSGVLFIGDDGKVYGSPTIYEDVEIPAGKTLVIPAGSTLTIADGATLTNNGDIIIEPGGKLIIAPGGKLINNGTITINQDAELRVETGATLINNGTINIVQGGALIIAPDGELINNGTINGQIVYGGYGPTPTPEQLRAAANVLAKLGISGDLKPVEESTIDRTTPVSIPGLNVVAQITISQDVDTVDKNEIAAINGKTLDAAGSGGVQFHKFFTDVKKTAEAVLYDFDPDKYAEPFDIDGEAHIAFNTVVVILDATAPDKLPEGFDFVRGAIYGQGLVEQTDDIENVHVIVVWDGEPNGYACDPLVASSSSGGSGGGGCAAGAAVIVAILGLALIKRRAR